MADVTLTVTITDANVPEMKELIEYEYFNGVSQSAQDVKTFVEERLKDFLLNRLAKIASVKKMRDFTNNNIFL